MYESISQPDKESPTEKECSDEKPRSERIAELKERIETLQADLECLEYEESCELSADMEARPEYYRAKALAMSMGITEEEWENNALNNFTETESERES